MKKLKKKTFFIVGFCILIISVLTLSICLLSVQEKSENFKVESEGVLNGSNSNTNDKPTDNKADNEIVDKNPEENITQLPEVYFEETINLANNGESYSLTLEENGEIQYEVQNEQILNISSFYNNVLILNPISFGETKLLIKIKTDTKIINQTYNIFISNVDKNLDITLLNVEADEPLKSMPRYDGTYTIYTANVISCRNLTNEDFYVEKSDNIYIVENSCKVEALEDGKSNIVFSFYVARGENAFLKVGIKNDFLNFKEEVYAEKYYDVVELIQKIEYDIYAYNGNQPNLAEGKYLLYIPSSDYELGMNEKNYYTFYVLEINKDLFNFELSSNQLKIEERDCGYIISAFNEGEFEIKLIAKDGSNQELKLNFKAIEAPACEFTIAINGVQNEYSFEEFYNYLENLKDFEVFIEDELLTIKTSTNPNFYSNPFSIVKEEGTAVSLEINNYGDESIVKFNFLEEGKVKFYIYYNNEILNTFHITVTNQEQEKPDAPVSDIEEIIVDKDYLYLDINSLFGEENASSEGYKIYCNQDGIIFDSISYNGFAYFKFINFGNYLIIIENMENGTKMPVNLKME